MVVSSVVVWLVLAAFSGRPTAAHVVDLTLTELNSRYSQTLILLVSVCFVLFFVCWLFSDT